MAKKDRDGAEKDQGGDGRIRVRPPLWAALEALAEEWVCDSTELGNRAVREFLERLGRWPVKRGGESAA